MTLEQAQTNLQTAETTLATAKLSLATSQATYDEAKKALSDLQAKEKTGDIVSNFINSVNASRQVTQ